MLAMRSAAGTALIAAALAMAVGVGPASADDERVVHVYNWSDYIDESILQEFEAETGIRVVYDVFDSNDILETKLLAGKTGYDVVVPTGSFLGRQISAGIYKPLDKAKLPNLAHMSPEVIARVAKYDPDNAHAIVYMWGTTGIGYNVGKIAAIDPSAPVDSWRLIFDPEMIKQFADCGIEMLDAPDEMIPAALNYIGEDPDSKDPDVIAKAEPVLAAIRPYITKFHSSQYINDLANGDICIAVGWSGDILQARDRAAEAEAGVEVRYAIPKEGALMWFDMMAIPADAPHPDNAHLFLDYIMRPEVIAKASNYINYANGNAASLEFVLDAVKNDAAIYPAPEVMAHLYTVTPYDQKAQRTLTRLWTRIKGAE
ncbi:MAG: polyamine ABC transporter substrate-binding protein [Alphaproteobacteria bacterium]|nr:polyamine ABC transporter substrate-binding protein [Alphaproteobacteria bacterium]